MAEEVEVKTRLTLDDEATKNLEDIKTGYKDVGEAQDHVQSGAAEWLKTMSAVAVGANLQDIVKQGWEMGSAFFNAANEAYNQQQAISGMVTTMQGLPWDESREQAEGLHRELRQLAIDIGQPIQDVTQGFEKLVYFTGATNDGIAMAKDQIKNMTVIANVLGRPVAQVAQEFGMIRDGAFSARTALSQMILKTGLITSDLKEANLQWTKMTEEERTRILTEGLNQVAGSLGRAEATFDDLLTSVKNLASTGIEMIGEPIVRRLLPVMKDLQATLFESADQIEGFAGELGDEFAKWSVDLTEVMKDGLAFAVEHGEEIKDAIVFGATALRETMEFIIENKEILMVLGGSRLAAGAAMGAGRAAMGAVTAFQGARAAGAVAGGTAALGGATAATGAASVAAAGKAALVALGPMAALTAAIASLAVAGDQAFKLYSELNDESDKSEEGLNRLAREEAALREIREGNLEQAQRLAQAIRDGTDAGREMAAQIEEQIAAQARRNQDLADQIAAGGGAFNIDQLVEAYNQAVSEGNNAMAQLAAETIFESDKLQLALAGEAAGKITGGIRSMGEHVKNAAIDFDEALREIQYENVRRATEDYFSLKGMKRIWENVPKASVSIDKVEVHQEFREADPDRVAVQFEQDLLQSAKNRLQARRATIFGV